MLGNMLLSSRPAIRVDESLWSEAGLSLWRLK